MLWLEFILNTFLIVADACAGHGGGGGGGGNQIIKVLNTN